MATQKMDTEKLAGLKEKLQSIKSDILTDFMTPIMNIFYNLSELKYWQGKKADSFTESLDNYWVKQEILTKLENEFDNLIKFVDGAIAGTTKTDAASASNFGGGETKQNPPAAPVVVPQVEQNTDSKGTGKISYVGTSNVISTSKPVYVGKKYNLSENDLKYLAYVAMKEQNSPDGVRMELSLIANRYEQNSRGYDNIRDYVQDCGWWADSATTGYKDPGPEYTAIARDVLNDGNRYLTSNVNQHYNLNSVRKVEVNGEVLKKVDGKYDTSQFIPNKTVIYESNSVKWTFVGFAPNNKWDVQGDPFGIG